MFPEQGGGSGYSYSGKLPIKKELPPRNINPQNRGVRMFNVVQRVLKERYVKHTE